MLQPSWPWNKKGGSLAAFFKIKIICCDLFGRCPRPIRTFSLQPASPSEASVALEALDVDALVEPMAITPNAAEHSGLNRPFNRWLEKVRISAGPQERVIRGCMRIVG